MHPFSEFAEIKLYYRKKGKARQTSFFQSQPLVSGDGYFQLKHQGKHPEIKMMLRQVDGETFEMDRLEMVLQGNRAHSPFDGLSDYGSYKIFQHGFHSWSLSAARGPAESDVHSRFVWKHNIDENPETPLIQKVPFRFLGLFPARGKFHSEGLLFAREKKAGSFMLYISGPGDQNVRFRIHLDKAGRIEYLAAIWDFNGRIFEPHTIVTLTPIEIAVQTAGEKQDDPAVLIERNMHHAAKNYPVPPNRPDQISGWCSWYYYFTDITEQIIRKNLAIVHDKKLPIDFFQIDDGYQREIGDWLDTNKKFPAGMKVLADEIKEAGYRAGIWYAPFLARPNSRLYKQHPEWVLRDHRGKPVMGMYNPLWGGKTYALDITHPGYLEYLAAVTANYRAMGYSYLKLDFLYTSFYRGQHYDRKTTGASRLRKAIEVVRKAAGSNTFLLGCGSPLFPVVGLFDGMRISMDVSPNWKGNYQAKILRDRNFPATRNALINSINRSFFHRKYWLNDPDCLMVRKTDTNLTENQVELMAAVMGLTGGMILFSDDMEKLADDRIALIEKTIQLNRKCSRYNARPIFMLDQEFPVGLWNPAGYLGIWNPTPKPRHLLLRRPGGVDGSLLKRSRNYWDGERIPWIAEKDSVEISLAPYESYVADLT